MVGQEGVTVDIGCLPKEMEGEAKSVVPRTLVDVLPNRMVVATMAMIDALPSCMLVAAWLCPRGWKTRSLKAGESCSMGKTRGVAG